MLRKSKGKFYEQMSKYTKRVSGTSCRACQHAHKRCDASLDLTVSCTNCVKSQTVCEKGVFEREYKIDKKYSMPNDDETSDASCSSDYSVYSELSSEISDEAEGFSPRLCSNEDIVAPPTKTDEEILNDAIANSLTPIEPWEGLQLFKASDLYNPAIGLCQHPDFILTRLKT